MNQADNPNTTIAPGDPGSRSTDANASVGSLSRRRLLGRLATSAAAGAVLTTRGAAAAPPPSPNDEWDDDELLSLQPAFDRLFDEWVRTSIADRGERDEYVAAICRETGLKEPPSNQNDPDWVAWEAASKRYLNAEPYGNRDEYFAKFNDAIGSLVDEIFAYVPTTLDGLRLQARALMAVDDDLVWANRAWDDEPDYPRLATFFEGLCDFLGLPFPPVPAGEEVRP